MAPLNSVQTKNNEFYTDRHLVAVIVGGTSGIGESTAKALARQYSNSRSRLRIYVVGRSQDAACKIVGECSAVCSAAEFEFVQAKDLTSIRETDNICAEIMTLEHQKQAQAAKGDRARVDLLIMSQGQVSFGPRQETSEGLDRQMSLLYYSRIRIIQKLLPLLQASRHPHVVSIFAGGLEAKLLPDDLSLRNPKTFSVIQIRSHVAHFTTMAFERLARDNPRLSLVHAFPGCVITPGYYEEDFPLWFKALWFVMAPLVRMFVAVPLEESGARMIYVGTSRFVARREAGQLKEALVATGTDGAKGTGAYAVDQNCEPAKLRADYSKLRANGFEETVWKHTMKAFRDIETLGRFKD